MMWLRLPILNTIAKHLSITSANFYANKVNQDKITEYRVLGQNLQMCPNFGTLFRTFWHHLCHLNLLLYQSIYLTELNK